MISGAVGNGARPARIWPVRQLVAAKKYFTSRL